MAGRIENKDLFASNLFKKTQEDAKLLVKEIDILEASLVKFAQAQKQVLNNQDTGTIQGIQKTKVASEKLNQAEIIANRVRKEKINLESKIKQSRKVSNLENQQLKVILQEQSKVNKQLARDKLGLVGAYEKESKKLIKLRKQYKDLAVSEGTTTKKTKALRNEITKLDAKLKGVDKSVGQSQRNVGNYGSAWSKVGSIFRGGLGVLGITAGLAGLSRLMSSTIGIFSGFEKANSNLQAVLGLQKEDMVALTESAKLLGSTTSFTASEVTGLQTSFAKLGFPIEEILLMQQSTLNAAAAMGSGLDETAALTGATLKSFGLDASEAGRVNDVLAKSTSASALDFQKLSSSMSTIAPVANSFGFSLEGTTSLLGSLANAGFDASSAATATRKILLNLADTNGKLAKSLKEPVTDLPSLVKGLKQLKGEGVDLGEALELTDVKSVAAFSTFLNGADDVLTLNDTLLKAGGTAQEMADVQLNNLSGSMTILGSAWEGFILGLEDGNGAFSRLLRNIVDLVTEVLSLLTGTEKLSSEMNEHEKVVRKYAKAFINVVKITAVLVTSFLAYKTVMIATNTITKVYTAVTNALKVAQAFMSGGMKAATTAQKALNTAMKANPIGLIITLVAGLVTAYFLFRDGANEAAKAQKAFNEELAFASKIAEKRTIEQRANTNENIRLLEEEIRSRRIAGEDGAKLDEELIERKNGLLEADIKRNKTIIKNARSRGASEKKEFQENIARIDAEIDATKRSSEFQGKGGEAQRKSAIKVLQRQRQQIVIEASKLAGDLTAITSDSEKEIVALNKDIISSEIDLTEAIVEEGKKQKSARVKRQKELELLRRQLEDAQDRAIENDLARDIQTTKRKFDRQIEAIKGNSQVEINLRIALTKERDKKIGDLEDELIEKRNKQLDKAELRFTDEGTEKEILKVLQKFDEESKKIEDSEILRAEDKAAFLINLTKETEDKINKIKKDAFDKDNKERSDTEDKRLAQLKKEEEAQKKAQEELKQAFEDTIGVIAELVDDMFTKRIEGIDKALGKTGERIDDLKQKANEGSLSAQESLAVERKREIELEKEKETERKRQEQAQAFFAVLTAFNQNDGNIGKTIADVTVLKALAGQLTAYDGVDDTGGRGSVDSKGGKIWTLHPNEQVWSKKDRGEVGFRSRDDIKDIVNLYDNGMINDLMRYDKGNEITPLSLKLNGLGENGDIVNKLNTLNQSIKGIDIPEGMVHIDEVRKLITLHSRKGNKSTKTHSKLFDR